MGSDTTLPPVAGALPAHSDGASGRPEGEDSQWAVGSGGDPGTSESPSALGQEKSGGGVSFGTSRSTSPGMEDDESEAPATAEEFLFTGFPGPLDLRPPDLLYHMAQLIIVPRKTGYSAFRRFILDPSPMAISLVECVFWYLHCRFFQNELTRKQQKLLLDQLSDLHLRMFLELPPQSRDYFTEYLSFAITSAACCGFLTHFPGSAQHIRTDDFQNEVYRETRRLITGVQSSPSVIRRARRIMNLIEKDPEVEYKRQKAMEPTFKEKTEAMIQRLDKMFDLKTIGPAISPKKGHRGLRHKDRGPYSDSEDNDDHDDHDDIAFRLKTHPAPRSYQVKFQSTGVSPLLQNIGYGKSGTRKIFIKQTQPPVLAVPEGRHKYRSSAIKAHSMSQQG